MDSENPSQENTKANRGDRPADDNRSEPQSTNLVTPFPAKPNAPALIHEKVACEQKRDWLDHIKLWAEMVGLLVLIAYTTFAGLQWKANEKAADAAKTAATAAKDSAHLTRRLVKGTEAAVCYVEINLSRDILNVSFVNRGKVSARNFHSSVEIARKSLPDQKVIGRFQRFELNNDMVRPEELLNHNYRISGFSRRDSDLVEQTRETIVIQGKFQYDDGFGDIVSQPFCHQQIVLHYPGDR